MIKKTIEYTDYNGKVRKEGFYFNLSKAELIEMDYSQNGGLDRLLNRIIETDDSAKQMAIFKDIIQKSYGVKSLDGKQFVKNPQVLSEFVQSEAYVNLFMELCTDANAAAEFIRGVVPADIASQIRETEISVND